MKKLFYYSIALLAAVSCAKEIVPQDNVETPKGDLKTFTIGASIDNSTIAPQAIASQELTKANLDAETLAVLWQAKDTIGLVTADGAITPAWLAEGYGGKTEGVFNYQADAEIAPVYAYYPYTSSSNVCQQTVEGGKLRNISIPGTQNVKSNTIAQYSLIMTAKVTEGVIQFKNACSIVKISVKGHTIAMRNLYVNTPEKAIRGVGTVDMDAEVPVFVPEAIDELSLNTNEDNDRYITLQVATSTNPINVSSDEYVLAGYAVMPPDTYHSLSFEVFGKYNGIDKYIQTYSPTRDITLNVGKVRPLNITNAIPAEFVDLSAGGKYANCYMIQGEAGENFGFGLYTRSYSGGVASNKALLLSDAYNASVLWQTTEGLISGVTYNQTEKMIYFKRDTQKKGNAVISLRARDGQVIYSWNIWVPGETVGTNSFGDYELMDRNLGSYNQTKYTQMGSYYQWGRKEPFPCPADGSSANANGMVVYPNVIKKLVAQNGKTQLWVKCHPNVYIWGNSSTGWQDWISNVVDETNTPVDTLWKADETYLKRFNDPCPYGYRVPMQNEYEAMGASAGLFVDAVTSSENMTYTIKDKNSNDAVFPIGGFWRRNSSTTSDMANVGKEMSLWTGTVSGSAAKRLYGTSSTKGTITSTQRRWGSNVRCVKFTEVDAE